MSDERLLRMIADLSDRLARLEAHDRPLTYVPLAAEWTSAAFNGTAFSTVGASTLIDISASYASAPADTSHVRAWNFRMACRDSAAWGAAQYYFCCGPSAANYYAVYCSCFGGDLYNNISGACATDANGDVYYRCSASGVNTLDVVLYIEGYFR